MSAETTSLIVGGYSVGRVQTLDADDLLALYNAVSWSTDTKDKEGLVTVVEGSDLVLAAWKGQLLVGLVRALSDDQSVVYLQDIIVHPEHQGRGIGRLLVTRVLERYAHVRQKVLLTDDRLEQLKFYDSLGFKNTRELVQTPLNAFVIIEGAELA